MTAREALEREIVAAEEQARPLLQIRVTMDAIEGTPALVPITPERARTIRLRLVENSSEYSVAIGDPEVYERGVEIVVHPADLLDALAHMPCPSPGPLRFYQGIKVVQS